MAIERITEFLSKLESCSSSEEIKQACTIELEYLDSCLALTSKKRTLTRYRNAIKTINPEHQALSFLKLVRAESDTIKSESKTQLYKDHTNLRPIDSEQLILKAESLLESDSYLAIALGLMLLTGRRATEILKTASFEYESEDSVIFTGQLKTKGSDNAQINPYSIPVLTSPENVIQALKRLRDKTSDFQTLSNDAVHSRANKNLNISCKRYFADLIPNCKAKDLRACYAQICYEYLSPDEWSINAYFASILGHSDQDLTTSQSYQDFYLV